MSVHISKGKMFGVTISVDDDRLKRMKGAPQAAAAALVAGATYWHTGILPKHFDEGANRRYGYAKRAIAYLKRKGKAGKPDLVYSGSLRNDVTSASSRRFVINGQGVRLAMYARVLNLCPTMSEKDADYYVPRRGGTSMPNLKREIIQITDDEREAVAAVVTRELELAFAPSDERPAATRRERAA